MRHRTAKQYARGLIAVMGDRAEDYAARRAELFEEINNDEISADWRRIRMAVRDQVQREAFRRNDAVGRPH